MAAALGTEVGDKLLRVDARSEADRVGKFVEIGIVIKISVLSKYETAAAQYRLITQTFDDTYNSSVGRIQAVARDRNEFFPESVFVRPEQSGIVFGDDYFAATGIISRQLFGRRAA